MPWAETAPGATSAPPFLVLTSNGVASGAIGGVTFSINNADPWVLTTSAPMSGSLHSMIVQYAAGATWDYWSTAVSGVTGLLPRGKSWNAATSGNIGLVSGAYNSMASGVLKADASGKVFKIQAHSNGNFGMCVVTLVN